MNLVSTKALTEAALRLHKYLLRTHWTGQAIRGPDQGVRWNARAGRFVKSYLRFLPWSDNYIYAQSQKYWIRANWLLSDLGLADTAQTHDLAIQCSEYLLCVQQPEGYWEYPNPEWKGRIATVEGNYAAMGLVETFSRTGREAFLEGAIRWYDYAMRHIGFQGRPGNLAINYFGNVGSGRVPNNSVSALAIFAMLAKATKDERFLESCRSMVNFLREFQVAETGELPYSVRGVTGKGRIHFLCYQYNAFELLNLAAYYRITLDQDIWPVLQRLAVFVSQAVTETGACRYNCHQKGPEVCYYTAAVGAALREATRMGLGDYGALADRAFRRVLSLQRPDGGMAFHSNGNYRFLADRRSYPRYLAMMLYHLVGETQAQLELRNVSQVAAASGRASTAVQPTALSGASRGW